MLSRSFVLLCALPATVLVSLALGSGSPPVSGPLQPTAAPQPSAAPPLATTDGALTLTVTPDRSKVSSRSDGLVRVRVDLHGAAAEAGPSLPSDIVVALDTSGSMSGPSIATAQASVRALVDAMGPADRLAVVAFSSGAQTLGPPGSTGMTPMTPEAQKAWRQLIDGLEAGGGTDMVSGLSEAVRIAEQADGRATRILLVTDGQPNTEDGLVALANEAARTGTPLTAVGIGSSYNEGLLATLADQGTGNFFWARPEMNLAEVFDAELHDAGAAVASRAQLRLQGGARLVDASGLPVEQGNDAQTVNLGTVLAGRTRTVWLTLQVPTRETGAVDLGGLTVDWQGNDGPATLHTPLGAIEVVKNAEEALAAIDGHTWEAGVVGDEWNGCKQDVARLTQQGDKAGAIARLASYKSKVSAENRVVQSDTVTANLAEVDTYERDMTAQFEGADAAQKRNVWSKAQTTTSYKGRRSGQSSTY